MKLSAALLCEKLPQYAASYTAGADFGLLCLGRPEFAAPGRELSGRRLFIARPDDISPEAVIPSGCCLFLAGGGARAFSGGGSVIVSPPGTDIFTLFNAVQELYDVYDEWDGRLRQSISSRRGLQSIIDLSSPMFENPLCFTDASYRFTAMSDCARRGGDAESIVPRDPASLFDPGQSAGETLLDRGDLAIRRCRPDEKNILCASLRSHQKFVVGIMLIEHHTKFRGSDPALLAHMADYVLMLFEYNAALRQNDTLSLVTVFIRLLDNQTVIQPDLESSLSVFDWRIGDSYELYYLKLPSPEFDYNYLTFQGRQLEKQLPSALAIAYGGDIVMIHNLTRSKEREPAARLHAFLRSRELAYGRSRVFHDIGELRGHYAQAVYALTYGRAQYPAKLFHRFSDYCFEFMIEHCRDAQSAESLFPGGLSELIEHDRAHGTEYLETLSAFCEKKFNATHAADALHIHRTTFLDRMKRIRELLDVDFDDPRDRLHLLLSLELLSSLEKQRGTQQ